MEMENETTEDFNTKGKIKLLIEDKVIVLIDVYYLKSSKNIIITTKFMSKGFKVIRKGYMFQIINNNNRFPSESKFIMFGRKPLFEF